MEILSIEIAALKYGEPPYCSIKITHTEGICVGDFIIASDSSGKVRPFEVCSLGSEYDTAFDMNSRNKDSLSHGSLEHAVSWSKQCKLVLASPEAAQSIRQIKCYC